MQHKAKWNSWTVSCPQTTASYVRFKDFMTVTTLIMFFWVKSPCGLVGASQCCWEACCLHFQPWRCKQHASPKLCIPPTSPHWSTVYFVVYSTTLWIPPSTQVHDWTGCGRKRQWPYFRHYPGTCLEGLRKPSQDSRSPGPHLKLDLRKTKEF
jgi:hypothetical protein